MKYNFKVVDPRVCLEQVTKLIDIWEVFDKEGLQLTMFFGSLCWRRKTCYNLQGCQSGSFISACGVLEKEVYRVQNSLAFGVYERCLELLVNYTRKLSY